MCLFFFYFVGRDCFDDVFEVSREKMSILEKVGWYFFRYLVLLVDLVFLKGRLE